jgi:hypothetical protein
MFIVFDTGVGKLICTFMVIDLNGLYALIFRVALRCLIIDNRIRLSFLETLVDLYHTNGLFVVLWLKFGLICV